MKKTNTDSLNCHYCNSEKSVEFKEIRTKGFVEFKVGKCKDCKKQNGLKSILKHNEVIS